MALLERGRREQAKMVQNILPKGVECIFVRQPVQLGLGHAVLCAERAVGEEPFAVILADDFLTGYQKSTTSELLDNFKKSGKSQISVTKIYGAEISKYGVVKPGEKKGSIAGLVEKPDFGKEPSNLASIGRYVLTPKIFSILKSLNKGASGELQLADAIDELAKQNLVEALEITGKRFDCGSVDGFVKAIIYEYKRRRETY